MKTLAFPLLLVPTILNSPFLAFDFLNPSNKKYVFLGDFVDRGRQSLETAMLLLAYKARYPDKFTILRGNHETSAINRNYGFYREIAQRYGPRQAKSIWTIFNDTFAWLPYLGLIGKKFLCEIFKFEYLA
uniref:Serine/threonine-protein phosphatase n=1 Tax=Globodera rostochiensis TaxID=31243 RepID=A0A914IB18_GLORO